MRSVDLCQATVSRWQGDVGMEPAVQKTDFASLYLLSEILREDSDVRQPSTGKPKAGLRRTAPHIAELSSLVKTPDLANAVGDNVPHEMTYNILLVLVARSRDDDICLQRCRPSSEGRWRRPYQCPCGAED